MKPGPLNLITDVAGLTVGNAHDDYLKSGVTVVMCEENVTASVAVHGGGPGTRDVSLLMPENSVETVDAVVLSGGSAFRAVAEAAVVRSRADPRSGFVQP